MRNGIPFIFAIRCVSKCFLSLVWRALHKLQCGKEGIELSHMQKEFTCAQLFIRQTHDASILVSQETPSLVWDLIAMVVVTIMRGCLLGDTLAYVGACGYDYHHHYCLLIDGGDDGHGVGHCHWLWYSWWCCWTLLVVVMLALLQLGHGHYCHGHKLGYGIVLVVSSWRW